MSDDDTVTELTNVRVSRVDAVDEPAHGMPWVLLKSHDVDPALVAERLWKAKYDTGQLKQMGKDGRAYRNPDGSYSYPIADAEDLDNAIRAVGRGGAEHDAIRRYIARRAKQLKATDKIPDTWASDGTIQKAEAGMDDDAVDDLNGRIIEPGDVVEDAAGLVAPTHQGDPDDVTSPAWEAVDAARARAAVQTLSWLKGLVQEMEEREDAEVAMTGDLGDARSSIDLAEALSGLDCALGILAKFAVDEQAEANGRAQEVADQAEALGIVKAITTATEAITKAGRVLSAANEQSLRAAHAALSEVLGRVPAPAEEAPVAEVTKAADAAPGDVEKAAVGSPDGGAPTEDPGAERMPVAGENGDAEATGTESTDVPVSVTKAADGMDVETLRGMLMKLVRALPASEVTAAFQSMAGAVSPTGDGGSDADTEDTGDGDAADAAPAPAPAAPAPAAPADADVQAALDSTGVPTGTDVDTADTEGDITKTQAGSGIDVEALVKALKAAVVPLEERQDQDRATFDDKLAKALTAALAPMEERLTKMEQTPVPGGVMLNGMAPGMRQVALRGQDATEADPLAGIHKTLKEIAAENPHGAAVASGAVAYDLLASRMGRTAR